MIVSHSHHHQICCKRCVATITLTKVYCVGASQAFAARMKTLGYVPVGRQLYLLPDGASLSVSPSTAAPLMAVAEEAAQNLAAAGEDLVALRCRMRFALTLCPAAHRVPSYR